MGLILDTGILIASKRRAESIEDILRQARASATFNVKHFKLIPGLNIVTL